MKKYSRIIFGTLSILIFIGLEVVWLLAEFAIRRWLGYSTHGGTSFIMFVVPVLAVALVLALMICNSLGILEFNRTVEVFRRTPASAPVSHSLELRSPPSQYANLAVGFGVTALVLAVAVWRLPAVSGTRIYGYAFAAFFALIGALCLIGILRNGEFIARINADGVTGGSKTALWNEVATLEIAAQKTPFGTAIICNVKDETGKMLTMFGASRAGEAKREAFLAALQSQFIPAEKFPPDSGTPQEGVWPPPPTYPKEEKEA